MLILTLAVNLIIGARAIVTTFPSNSAAIAGSEVILRCRTNASKNLMWLQPLLKPGKKGSPPEIIFTGNKFSNEAAQRYDIIRESDGQFNLKFNATLNHGSEYMCCEPGGDNFSSQIIVLASEPKCYVNEMPATANPFIVDEEERVELKCNLTFAGRWSPQLQWTQQKNAENNWMIVTAQEASEERDTIFVISTTLSLNATQNETSFMCTTRFLEYDRPKTTTATNIPEYSHNWTSPTFILRSYYEFNNRIQENEQNKGRKMRDFFVFGVTTLVVSALLLIVVIATVKLNKSAIAKIHQSPIHNASQQATTNNPAQPAINHLVESAAHSLATYGVELQVIYSDVMKNTVECQEDSLNYHLGCEHQQPAIYSEVYNPECTTQIGQATSQHVSAQCANLCKVTGADGTEYSLLPVFQSRQPLHQPRKQNFETSVYAPIDHNMVPSPPKCNRWIPEDS